jgi:hypothetical protein
MAHIVLMLKLLSLWWRKTVHMWTFILLNCNKAITFTLHGCYVLYPAIQRDVIILLFGIYLQILSVRILKTNDLFYKIKNILLITDRISKDSLHQELMIKVKNERLKEKSFWSWRIVLALIGKKVRKLEASLASPIISFLHTHCCCWAFWQSICCLVDLIQLIEDSQRW